MIQLISLWALFLLQLIVERTVSVCLRINTWIDTKRIHIMYPNATRSMATYDDENDTK